MTFKHIGRVVNVRIKPKAVDYVPPILMRQFAAQFDFFMDERMRAGNFKLAFGETEGDVIELLRGQLYERFEHAFGDRGTSKIIALELTGDKESPLTSLMELIEFRVNTNPIIDGLAWEGFQTVSNDWEPLVKFVQPS